MVSFVWLDFVFGSHWPMLRGFLLALHSGVTSSGIRGSRLAACNAFTLPTVLLSSLRKGHLGWEIQLREYRRELRVPSPALYGPHCPSELSRMLIQEKARQSSEEVGGDRIQVFHAWGVGYGSGATPHMAYSWFCAQVTPIDTKEKGWRLDHPPIL